MTRRAISWRVLGAILAVLGVASPGALADSDDGLRHESEHDHDRAHRARERGEIRPLEEILPALRARFPGEMADIELEREHGLWVYEFKVIDPTGRLLEIEVDARSGEVVEVEGE
jgi:uncharacterized membrane protein YkoI